MTRAPDRSGSPARLASPKSTSKGPGDIKAPKLPATVCATDDAVEQNAGTSEEESGKDPGAAYDRIATKSKVSSKTVRVSSHRVARPTGGTETRSSGRPPAIHRWPEIIDCPSDEEAKLREAWVHAHDYVWAAHAMLSFIDNAYPSWRPLLWTNGYDSDLDDEENGRSNAVDASNWSPLAWFGNYEGQRLAHAQDVVSDLWWRIRNEKIRIDCDLGPGVQGEGGIVDEDTWSACHQKNPGSEGGPDAYHFPQGKIAVCASLFNKAGTSEYATRFIARLLTHEMTHWIKWEDGAGHWVKDAHTIWCKNEGPKSNHVCHWATDKMYGSEDAVHLATKHPGHAYRNTDNFAYFIWRVGRAVKEGHLRYFPTSWEGFPEPPWSPPNPSDNVCSIMMDDIPGNDPGVDICDGLKGQDFDDCKGSVTGKLPPLCR
jgi:hypothetical protein